MSKFLPFEEALAVAQTLGPAGTSGQREWAEWCKAGMRPTNVPSNPDKAYTDGGWQGWGHWLGTGNAAPSTTFLPFDEALRVARQLRLVSHKEWLLWCRSGSRPANMPANPDKVYVHDGWFGWEHWLYHGNLPPAAAQAARAADRGGAAHGPPTQPRRSSAAAQPTARAPTRTRAAPEPTAAPPRRKRQRR